MWVNLSPFEKNRIIPEAFGITDMGRDLLAQDYVLKQVASALTDPETKLGEAFFKSLKGHNDTLTDAAIQDHLSKIWIVPDSAEVYENNGAAYILDSRLKVKCDLPADNPIYQLLPVIEKEINEGDKFVNLRQIYDALVLATWYKRKIKNYILENSYIRKNKVVGIDIDDKQAKDKIYQNYIDAFKKGVYTLIKEEYDPKVQQIIPKKYFSGGAGFITT